MSIFGDVTDDILNDDHNQNINENELPSDDDQEKNEGDDVDENQKVIVEPKKRSVRNPRPKLTVQTLSGNRGIHTIEEYFKDMKFHGKGHERTDLNEVMRRLQHWAHRMYPNYKFEDVLSNIERLGKKKPLQVHMNRYRLNLLEENPLNSDNLPREDEENQMDADEPFDEFDALLGEQIAMSRLAPKTPSHNRTDVSISSSVNTPKFGYGRAVMSTPYTGAGFPDDDISELAQPLPPSQPSTPARRVSENETEAPAAPSSNKLSAEQMAKIAENRRLAQERLKAKREALQQQREPEQRIETLTEPWK